MATRHPKHRARHGNHPADSVNWWDATAFCYWLGARLGYDEQALGLQTEFEWQRAAIGGDPRLGEPKRSYPWGSTGNRRRALARQHMREQARRSTAVGLYPLGASPAGVLDMAGTLWEWCLNAFEVPGVPFPGRRLDRRVLRGGSWTAVRTSRARPSAAGTPRINRDVIFGFRVLCSSPIFGH